MQHLLVRRSMLAVRPRLAPARTRTFAEALPEGHPAGQQAVVKDVVMGLGLGFVTAGAWWLWAKKEFRKMDNFRASLAASKKE